MADVAYRMGWYIKNRIIFTRLWGTQTQEDGLGVNRDLSQLLLNSSSNQIYVLVHSSELEQSPPPSMSLLKSTFSALNNPDIVFFIAIGNISVTNNLMGIMLGYLFRMTYLKMPTIEQALDFIRQRDGSIDWSLADPSVLEKPDDVEADSGHGV